MEYEASCGSQGPEFQGSEFITTDGGERNP